jgi:putative ABC transport system permease protein
MIAPRWRKVLRDISDAPFRSLLVVVAISAGVFGAATILIAYTILGRELEKTYADTRPASAILSTNNASDETTSRARSLQQVTDVEARPVIRGRLRVGEDQWVPLVVYLVRDFNAQRMDKFKKDSGTWPPSKDEVLLERSGMSIAQGAVGDRVVISTRNGESNVRVAGTVHAAGLAPGWMDHVVTGFAGWDSVLRGQAETPQLRLMTANSGLNEARILEKSTAVKIALEQSGIKVTRIDIPPPGRHPHADQMKAFLFLLGSFGLLTLALSTVLTANMIHAILSQQVKQIGVMLAVGASRSQVAGMYLGQVAILSAAALAVALPMALRAGRGYARFSATILNAEIISDSVPVWVMLTMLGVGMVLPLLAAMWPVYRASQITVRDALSSGEPRKDSVGRVMNVPGLSRPLLLSLRTSLQRRGRLALTVSTLALGGGVFLAAMNVSAGWKRAVAEDSQSRRYDLEVVLDEMHTTSTLMNAVASVPEVVNAEYWVEVPAVASNAAGNEARVALIAVNNGSTLLNLPLLSGRWLDAGGAPGVVIGEGLASRLPGLNVGSTLMLQVNGKTITWPVAGVAKGLFSHASGQQAVYAPRSAVLQAMGNDGSGSRTIKLVTREHDEAGQLAASRGLEKALRSAGVGVLGVMRMAELRRALEDHLVIITGALLLATGLVVVIGMLGVSSTLSMNVVERTREFGILSAIGATPTRIAGFVMFEGAFIGVLSWAVSVVFAVPVTMVIDRVAGEIFLKRPLEFSMPVTAVATWLGIVVVLSVISSWYPAMRAGQMQVREALAYE